MARKRNSENNLVVSGGAASAPSRRKSERGAKHLPVQPVEFLEGAAVAAAASGPAIDDGPAHEEIARLAYSYWEARGCQGGCPEEDWTRAEQELRAQPAAVANA